MYMYICTHTHTFSDFLTKPHREGAHISQQRMVHHVGCSSMARLQSNTMMVECPSKPDCGLGGVPSQGPLGVLNNISGVQGVLLLYLRYILKFRAHQFQNRRQQLKGKKGAKHQTQKMAEQASYPNSNNVWALVSCASDSTYSVRSVGQLGLLVSLYICSTVDSTKF